MENDYFLSVSEWIALLVMVSIIGFVLQRMYEIFVKGDGEINLKKFVVVVRQARPGEFGGYVSMQSIKRADEWRVAYAETPADAVNNVLGAGEVPVLWMAWESLSWWRKAVLHVREVWNFVRAA